MWLEIWRCLQPPNHPLCLGICWENVLDTSNSSLNHHKSPKAPTCSCGINHFMPTIRQITRFHWIQGELAVQWSGSLDISHEGAQHNPVIFNTTVSDGHQGLKFYHLISSSSIMNLLFETFGDDAGTSSEVQIQSKYVYIYICMGAKTISQTESF